jgi:RNA polymerase sigma-70 factor (ECF subfamily)
VSGDTPQVNRNLLRSGPFYGRQPLARVVDQRHELRRLVDAARAGDPEAFGAVFDICYPGVYRYAYARLGRVADAEDAAAEAFASVLTALPRFRWRGPPFEAWLFRIATSKITDAIRRRARDHQPLPLAAPDETDDATDPAQLLAAAERRQLLLDAIDRLPDDQRDVVLLRFFGDRSLAEVADGMGRSVGAVKQLQFRALVRLREVVER